MKLLVAKPRGFCAGVDRAVDILELALAVYGPPVYMRHEIVHNRTVVERLEEQGAIFVERTEEIPEGAHAVFSAHGVSPAVREEAKARKLRMIDATCPLVTKVHLEAIRFAKEGYRIIIIGHKGHVEMEGTMGEVPSDRIELIESVEDVAKLDYPAEEKLALLTQTTLSIDDTKAIIAALKRHFPNLVTPPKEDICYATTNRQAAVKAIASQCDVVLVVGSQSSSNSNRLREVAEAQGAKKAYLIDRAVDIQPKWLKGVETIGVTSGASAPDDLVKEVVLVLKTMGAEACEEVEEVDEHVYFSLPKDLIDAAADSEDAKEIIEKHRIASGTKMRTK